MRFQSNRLETGVASGAQDRYSEVDLLCDGKRTYWTAGSPSGNDANLASPSHSIVVPGYCIYHQVARREVSWLDCAPGPRGRGLGQRLLEEVIQAVVVVGFAQLQ